MSFDMSRGTHLALHLFQMSNFLNIQPNLRNCHWFCIDSHSIRDSCRYVDFS